MRELLRKYRPLLLGACLLLAALLLYSNNLRRKDHTSVFEQAALMVTAPFLKGFDHLYARTVSLWDNYVWLVDTAGENDRLREENLLLKAEVENLREIRLANERLRMLLEFKDELTLSAVPARVIGADASSWSRTVLLDKGSRSGVREGMAVVTASGVVGRVIKVAPGESRALLITDAASAVASLVQRTRTRGVSRGRGDSLILDFALRQEDIQVGDRLVTSGTGGVFPKGLLVGEVVRVVRGDYGLFQTVEVAPATDFSRLEEVLILIEELP
ncbi:rod shape-determining protein MreC [Geoalkalibacter ferrihydriticus]|uniref:Cell shape-determining protein MreC n=2 Tax=Geoalkalibacter ferrihydriticus TaxID=392333 RepID=A0A0C2EE06_9BACT|nr:rod shape-determining protein MreC [Geoalkalibacter ferrihydriticus]KIH76833.1 rod shape-determining protein MreC [Geoalkalibacter ferrihydriticus DSM 17813]SDL48707.1 rod shape-determining protein MreC [Geoalkalibacter ferrihydriticus]